MDDTSGPVRPEHDLDHVADAQGRLLTLISGLTDGEARRASLLPGWSVSHVLTHVARNADSHRRRAEAAARGEVVDQYPGGFEGRAREIETGARRDAATVVADVDSSARTLRATWERLPPSAWGRPTRDVAGHERPLRALPCRRWQELEVHAVDLGLGIGHRDWPEDFVATWLPRLRSTLGGRLPVGATPPTLPDPRDELAWLYGRLDDPGLPVLEPWA